MSQSFSSKKPSRPTINTVNISHYSPNKGIMPPMPDSSRDTANQSKLNKSPPTFSDHKKSATFAALESLLPGPSGLAVKEKEIENAPPHERAMRAKEDWDELKKITG